MFVSYQFIIFLLILLILYYTIPKKVQWILLLAANFIFYAYADIRYPVFIIVTAAVIYFAAVTMEYCVNKGIGNVKKRSKIIMLTALLIVLGILVCVKYTNFIIRNFNFLLKETGHGKISFVNFIVPLGISFYTFQGISYLLDVYWGKCKAQRNFLKFLLFISFFPQLIQGPISRYNDISKSLYEKHVFNIRQISYGVERILWGYFKKVVIADRIGTAVVALSESPDYYTGVYVMLGMVFYAIQLYADFTGGIDITIGIAQTLGVHLKENFIRPYFSKNTAEYWRRWHISMGTWFRDYVFYPCGTSRAVRKIKSFFKKRFGANAARRVTVYIATITVWLATGIWHGAEWHFVAWGLGNGIILLISEECVPLYRKFHKRFPKLAGNALYNVFQILRTCFLMSCLRMFDTYGSVRVAIKQFIHMFTQFGSSTLSGKELIELGLSFGDYIVILSGVIIMLAVSILGRTGSVREKISKKPYIIRYLVFVGLFFMVLLFGAYGQGYDVSQFIYNQF